MKLVLIQRLTPFVLAHLFIGPPPLSAAEARPGVQLFYRMLGAQSNGPLLPKTRTVYAPDGAATTGQTGMADSGFTEYPFCAGRVSYTMAEQYAYFPRIASHVPIDPGGVNVGDILIDHVYEPDALVWGLVGREFIQTFVATGRELASLTMLVPSARGTFRAALLEGGPGGRQIGGAKSFDSGHSMDWGQVKWQPGEAPLQPGRTYGLRLWRDDGATWSPFLHSTGNCYDHGHLFVDGQPRPESDLGAWLIEEPADVSRALLVDADAQGWVFNRAGFTFVPRTPNVRLISVTVSPLPVVCCDVFLSVWTDENPPRRLAGPKRGLACGPANGPHPSHFLFGPDELPVEPGRRYRAGVVGWVEHNAPRPAELDAAPPLAFDTQAIVYGEPHPGAVPAIHNLKATFPVTHRIMRLSWSTTFPCPVEIEISRLSPGESSRLQVAAGVTAIDIPKLWPGHVYDFRLIAQGREGFTWRTPRYRLQIPEGPHPLIPRLYPEQPDHFVPLAPPPALQPPPTGPLRYRQEVQVVNDDFEEGLAGWTATPEKILYATAEEFRVSPPFGKKMAGWTHRAEKSREQVFEQSTLHQTIPTRPGHRYVLSARLHTVVPGGPRGDTRLRLFADPRGGMDFTGLNTSQWYWTEGRWLRFQHQWVAHSDRATIGLGFFRWRDLAQASAYADHVRVFDLGPAEVAFHDPAPVPEALPAVVLQERQVEFAEPVEAALTAPPGYVITGLGARAHEDNITTLWLQVRPLRPDGTLGPAEELRGGWEPDAHLEAQVILPEGYVATGFGGRITPEWDVKTLALWGRPLRADGTLGEEKMCRGGSEPAGGLERQVQLPPGRVLSTVGLNCGFNDLNRIQSSSLALAPTATARAREAR